MKYLIVIPARLASTRLPNKPLLELEGKSMIQRTYERCLLAVDDPDLIVVATDHKSIYNHIKELGYNAVMTSERCLTGTDRVAEVASIVEADYYINVQGDEPLINPDDIKKVINELGRNSNVIINGYAPIKIEEDYSSRSIPKVVFSEKGRLLYMSRTTIPGNKAGTFEKGFRQICIYAFPKESLNQFSSRKEKSAFEAIEDIEILRFLEMDIPVQMIEMSGDSIAVDTENDIEKVLIAIRNQGL